jgi:hypothetical protein
VGVRSLAYLRTSRTIGSRLRSEVHGRVEADGQEGTSGRFSNLRSTISNRLLEALA